MSFNKKFFTTGGIVASTPTAVLVNEPQSFTFLGSAAISGSNKPRHWHISNDGLHTIWANDNLLQIQTATLSTAWDITTASNGPSTSRNNYVRALAWNYDGSQQLGLPNVSSTIVGKNISPSYTLTNQSSSIISGLGQGYAAIFEPSTNGDYFYAGASQQIRQFTTTTGKLTSSDSYSDTTYALSGQPTVSFDGNYLYIQDNANKADIHVYSLGTAYDVTSTKTFVKILTLPSASLSINRPKASKDGNYFYCYEFNVAGGRVFWWQINY